jgi:hypothetical protein
MAILTQGFKWGRYMLLGLVAGAALQLCSPVWMLAQMGGPQPFWIFCALVVVPLLVLSLVFVKSCRTPEAVLAGLLFSLPVLVICILLPFEAEAINRYFRVEIWCDGVVAVIVSVLLSVFVSKVCYGNRAEPGSAPNVGPGLGSGSCEGREGPPSVT